MNDIKKKSNGAIFNDIMKAWERLCPICKTKIVHNYKPRNRHLKMSCVECGKKKKIVVHKEEEFMRKCPNCKEKIIYTQVGNRNQAEKKQKLCSKCVAIHLSKINTGKKLGEITKKKLSRSMMGRPILWKNKISESRKKYYQENPNELPSGKNNPMFGIHRFGANNPNFGKRWNEDAKRKARETHVKKYMERGYQFHNFNPNACHYFDRLNKEKGWKLRHALNGGEVIIAGYFLDSYDKKRNIVVEYDEPHHEHPKQKEKDVQRQKRIINELQCRFYRFNEREKELYRIV
jgi:hypothetical protein